MKFKNSFSIWDRISAIYYAIYMVLRYGIDGSLKKTDEELEKKNRAINPFN